VSGGFGVTLNIFTFVLIGQPRLATNTRGGGCTQVSRPGNEGKAGASEDALRTATIKYRHGNTCLTDACAAFKPRATKPDHWESVTGIKLPRASKAHKPADSGVVVGNGARRCSFQEVTLNAFKHVLQTGSRLTPTVDRVVGRTLLPVMSPEAVNQRHGSGNTKRSQRLCRQVSGQSLQGRVRQLFVVIAVGHDRPVGVSKADQQKQQDHAQG
jgi:hypothetical protein